MKVSRHEQKQRKKLHQKKTKSYSSFFIGFVLIMLVLTNPTKIDFYTYINHRTPTINQSSTINKMISSRNFFVFSIFSANGSQVKYLGVMRKFIPLGNQGH